MFSNIKIHLASLYGLTLLPCAFILVNLILRILNTLPETLGKGLLLPKPIIQALKVGS